MARSTKDLQSGVCGNCASAREDLCRNENCLNQRPQWAERYVEEFLGLPLLREFVLRSPRTIGRTEKEVANHLIMHGQGHPAFPEMPGRSDGPRRNENGTLGAKEQQGRPARRSDADPVRPPKTPSRRIPKGIAGDHPPYRAEDVFQSVDLNPDAADLPLTCGGIPITYLSKRLVFPASLETTTRA